jgi:hypothetical protein
VNLHDWIDEVCDALDIEVEIDESLVLDVARDAAHNVERPAAPITTYLLGYAAGLQGADPEAVERLAAAVTDLALKWDGADQRAEAAEQARLRNLEEIDAALVDVD